MRILLSSHGASPYGAERVLLALARVFSSQGWDVTLEVPHDGPLLKMAEDVPGVRVWNSRRPRLPRNAWEALVFFALMPLSVVRLWRRIRRERFDLVWANTVFNPFAALAGRLLGVPVVWHLHERSLPGLVGRLASWTVRTLAHRAVVVSRFVGATYQRAGLPLGHQDRLFNATFRPIDPVSPERDPERTFTVACIGQLEFRKRPHDVIRAVARLPGARGILAGDGKARAWAEGVIIDEVAEAKIELLGYCSDINPVFQQADCLVMPSLEEACPLVLFEALSAGIPVVAVRSGGIPEILKEAGLYFEPGDVDGILRCLRDLRYQDGLWEEFHKRSLKRAAELGPDTWAAEAVRLAEAAVAGQ